VTYKVTMGQVFFSVLPSFPVSVIFPMLHTRLHLHVSFTRRKMEEVCKGTIKQCSFGNPGELNRKGLLLFFGSKYLMARRWICRSLAGALFFLFRQKILHLEPTAMAAISLLLPPAGQTAPCHVSAG